MTGASRPTGNRLPKLIALCAVGAVGIGLGVSLDRSPTKQAGGPPEDAVVAASAGDGPGAITAGSEPARVGDAGGMGAPPRLADGDFPSILGPPRGPTPDFCDDDQWSRIGSILREFGEGEVVVDESDWIGRAAEARIGMASWVSKCRQDGAPVEIRGDESGEILAVYDSQNGYRSTRAR